MNAETIFRKYYNNNVNILTPFPYEYGVKKIGKYTLVYEKSKGRSPWSNWELRYAISFLIVQGKKVQKIDLRYDSDKRNKVDKYLNNLNEEMVEQADKYGEIKKL